ncbi:MAG: cupin domain-containing protein [Planctomycetaceae bacterium]|nr:cupin domain-containing protein [Planctomycetaceae bacterium]
MFIHDDQCTETVLDNGVVRKIKGFLPDLMLVELIWKKGQTGAVHHHPHRQAGYVVQGSFEADVEGEKTVLRAGDCYYTTADQPHGLVALEDDSVLLDVFTPMREDFVK